MAIIPLKAWYLEKYEPIREVVKRPQDLRLSRNSLLKSGLRADFLDDGAEVETSLWFQRYLEGQTVDFYIEGSGGYTIANIDLISHEIYFDKQDITANLDPVIYFSSQVEYTSASTSIRAILTETLEKINQRSRLLLRLEEASRPLNTPLRLSDSQLRKIRKSLLYIADGTPISQVTPEETPHLLLSSAVCAEMGYAIQCKRPGQILLLNMERSDFQGQFPFDIPTHRRLSFKNNSELQKTLPSLIEASLQPFNL